ncbi:PRC-barrel domain-containing protein [Microvirga calopogonii]|uniref:PRC-barrel domain-containing protein n=1 Tax=Microvirga calopogonii TaxID=2078013 RepID=UPI000E0DC890|nr:PRC-barrel domain-containing protein [Microvirga calopogonii]
MRFHHLLRPLLGAAAGTIPVLAQPSQPTAPSPQADAGGWIAEMQPDQWPTSKLEGLDVYSSNNGDKIGDIRDLILDGSGTIQAVVIRVGGYLGLGQRNIAVPFNQIKIVNEPRGNTSGRTTGEARLAGISPGGDTVASPAAARTAAVPAGSASPASSNVGTNNPPAPGALEQWRF